MILYYVLKHDKDSVYLRGKIDIPGKDSFIQTVRGVGYIIRDN